MNTSAAAIRILNQLEEVVDQISDIDFCRPSKTLSESTIGQHLRHTLEFFVCLGDGVKTGRINYDKRAHDPIIETDKFVALSSIAKIRQFVESMDMEQELILEVGYDLDDSVITMKTNAARELVYNVEHAVHHMAIMKIGIREVSPNISLPQDFGIAASTIRFRKNSQVNSIAGSRHE